MLRCSTDRCWTLLCAGSTPLACQILPRHQRICRWSPISGVQPVRQMIKAPTVLDVHRTSLISVTCCAWPKLHCLLPRNGLSPILALSLIWCGALACEIVRIYYGADPTSGTPPHLQLGRRRRATDLLPGQLEARCARKIPTLWHAATAAKWVGWLLRPGTSTNCAGGRRQRNTRFAVVDYGRFTEWPRRRQSGPRGRPWRPSVSIRHPASGLRLQVAHRLWRTGCCRATVRRLTSKP